jgi:hypothetical protein
MSANVVFDKERRVVYRGHIRNGKIELDQDALLPEGAEVEVLLRGNGQENEQDGPTLYDSLKDFIGVVDDLPEDFSVNHDHYLYGTPKRE